MKNSDARMESLHRVYMKYRNGERSAKGLAGRVAPSRVAHLPEYFMYSYYIA